MRDETTLASVLTAGVDTAAALVEVGGDVTTHDQLRDDVARVRNQLSGLGVAAGDRVGIVMANGVEIVVTFLAVTSLGAAAAPLNPALSADEIHREMADLGVSLALFDEGSARPVAQAMNGLGLPGRLVDRSSGRVGVVGAATGALSAPAASEDVALLLHTSGTTSKPKSVPLAQRNLTASVRTIAATYGLGADDIGFVVMPLFHVHGLVAGVLAPLAAGGSVVLAPKFSGSSFWADIRRARATWFTAVPTIHHVVLQTLAGDVKADHRLRFARSCSSTLAAPLWRKFESVIGVPLLEAYGMTEASHQMTSNPLPPGRREPGSVGRATGVEVQVVDEAWQPVPTGSRGEVCVRGPSVVDGYLNNPDANAASFRDGWFRTGDVGTLDADGYLRLVGRLKEIINRGGEKISPYEVEAVLLDHPSVSEAAVYPVPDDKYGESVAAVVVATGRVDRAELVRHCEGRLAGFKVPTTVTLVEAIPKGPTGKIQRRLLASLVKP